MGNRSGKKKERDGRVGENGRAKGVSETEDGVVMKVGSGEIGVNVKRERQGRERY